MKQLTVIILAVCASVSAQAGGRYMMPGGLMSMPSIPTYSQPTYYRTQPTYYVAPAPQVQVAYAAPPVPQVVYAPRPAPVQQVVYVPTPAPTQTKVVYVDRQVIVHDTVPTQRQVVPEETPRDAYIKECQRYGYSKTRCTNIWDDKLPEQETPVAEAQPKSRYRPATDEEIIIEKPEQPKQPAIVFEHNDPKLKPVAVAPDVRLTDEQDQLTKLGIPIISGVRTAQKQESLKDHQGPNGQWYTSAGNPVSEHSLHLSGNAIDTGPLNANQRRILAENGWFQPIPRQDPNHWEKVRPTLVANN